MRIYLLSLLVMIAVVVIHTFGMKGYYVTLPWLDVLSHSLVCFGIALCIGNFVLDVWPQLPYKKLLVIFATFIIGFAWEWLEAYYDVTGHPLWSYAYYFDTVKDLIVDTLGAWLATVIVWHLHFKAPPASVPETAPALLTNRIEIQNQ